MTQIGLECLPACLMPIADYAQSDDLDDRLIIFSLIGALSSVAGHLADVVSKYPKGNVAITPITVSNILLAESGTGKGRLTGIVFGEIENWISMRLPAYKKEIKKYKMEMRKMDRFTAKDGVFIDGEIPDEPVSPNFFMEDFTIESLIKKFYVGSPHLFIFSDEGGTVTSCRAFQPTSVGTTLSLFNQIHCGEKYNKATAADGEYTLIKKRITLLLMIQEKVYEDMMEKFAGLGDSGIYQRIFPIRTESKCAIEAKEEGEEYVCKEQKKITPEYKKAQQMFVNMCDFSPRIDAHGYPAPLKIRHGKKAHRLWRDFYIENNNFCALNPKNETNSYRKRIFETAARYAALFQIGDNFYNDNPAETEIVAENMEKAIVICRYGLACQIKEFVNKNEELENVEKLLVFIGDRTITRREIMQRGPWKLRKSKTLDKILIFLLEEGLAEKTKGGFRRRADD